MTTEELKSERRRAAIERKIYAEGCPTCLVGVSEYCIVVRATNSGRMGKEMAVPHRERVFAAIRTQNRKRARRPRPGALA